MRVLAFALHKSSFLAVAALLTACGHGASLGATGGAPSSGGSPSIVGDGGAPAVVGQVDGGSSASRSGASSQSGATNGGSVNGGGVNGGGVNGGGVNGGGVDGGGVDGGGVDGGGGGGPNQCPLELEGFATLEGGTTGGGDATPTIVTTQAELKRCATDRTPRVCRVQGTLTFSPFEEIRVESDKTIIGSGGNAEIVMGGFFVGTGVHNVIIRNLTIRDSFIEGQYDEGGDEGGDRDGVQMDTAHHIWIDHCRFSHLGDGQIDSRKDTTFETVSWNILENHNKAFGIGWTENVTSQITIHHNWLRNTTQRNPSTDNVLRAHLFNNLLENLSSYGNYARGGTNMVLENSVFKKVKDPHYYDTGTLVATGNLYDDVTGLKEQTGVTFSFFEPAKLYSYRLDPAADVATLLARCAGPRRELGN